MILTGGLGKGGGLAARGYGAWSMSIATTATQGIGRAGVAGPGRTSPVVGMRSADVEAARRQAASGKRLAPVVQDRPSVVAATRHTVTASARPAGSMASRRNTQGRTR